MKVKDSFSSVGPQTRESNVTGSSTMLPYCLHHLCNRQNAQLFLVVLVVATFGLVVQYGPHPNGIEEECSAEDDGEAYSRKYISSTCDCGREVVIGDDVDNTTEEFKWCSDESSMRGSGQKIVTYALFGNAQNASVFRRYYSLLRNISLTVEKVYPGWVIRIYHNIPNDGGDADQQLCKVYCRYSNVDLCSVPKLIDRIGNNTAPIDPQLLRGLNGRMYRYLVMLDPNVDLFISRDIDSLIFQREVDAVEQWLASNYTFHLMRDHRGHGSIILAGEFDCLMLFISA